MSRMNELSIEEQEAAYAAYVEEQREELRAEGRAEERASIIQSLIEQGVIVVADNNSYIAPIASLHVGSWRQVKGL